VQVRSTRASKNTPMAFTDMNRDQIKQMNHGQDIPYLLSLTPSVTMTSDAGNGIGYTSLRIRGTAPERINITANGIPMNDAESNSVFWVNMGDFASSLQSMQVQRGVGTSTNGAGAFGATLNMQTESIGMNPYVGVDLSGGSYHSNKQTVRFSTGLPDEGHSGLQGRFSHIGSKGYIDRASAKLFSYFLQYGYFDDNRAVKLLTWYGQEETYHAWDFSSHYAQDRYGRTYNPCGYMGDDANGNPLYYDKQTDNYAQHNYQLIWNERFSNRFSLNAALHYTRGDGYYEQFKGNKKLSEYFPLTEAEQGMKSDLVRRKHMANDFYGAVASLIYNNRKNLDLTVGGGWNRYDGDHFGRIDQVTNAPSRYTPRYEYYRDNAKKTDLNVYAKGNYQIFSGFRAFLDLQYRHVNYKMQDPSDWYVGQQSSDYVVNDHYNFFNPKLGVNYQFLPNHRVYASYAIAHKEPTRNDMEDMLAESNGVDPKAERLEDAELGYKYESKTFTFNANFYRMNYDNQFVLTGAQDSNGEMVARNIKDSYRMGMELTAAWRPVKGFAWEANATWSRNRARHMNLTVIDTETWEESVADVGSTHLAYSPDFIAANSFSYEWRGIRASLMSKYVSKQYMTNSNFKSYIDEDNNGRVESAMLDAFFTTDLDLNYTFRLRGLKQVTVGCTVYNLFGEKYESNGSCGLNFKRAADGSIQAFNNHNLGFWTWSTYSAQAPTHFLAYLSISL